MAHPDDSPVTVAPYTLLSSAAAAADTTIAVDAAGDVLSLAVGQHIQVRT